MDNQDDKPKLDEPRELDSDGIRAAIGGDEAALACLIDTFSPWMLAWSRLYLRDNVRLPMEPEDLVQDVWMRLLPELQKLQPHPESGRWTAAMMGVMKTTLRNRVIDVRRAALRSKLHLWSKPVNDGEHSASGPSVADSSSGPVAKLLRSERQLAVRAALEQLTPRERDIYVKRIFEDATIDELASEFGMSPDAVIKARQRVRHRLEGILSSWILDQLDKSD